MTGARPSRVALVTGSSRGLGAAIAHRLAEERRVVRAAVETRVRRVLRDAHDEAQDAATAFGCAYVLEGATLGGRSLMPTVESRLGLNASHGAAFLSSYGAAVGEMWRSFGAALDRCCAGAQQQAQAAAGAIDTFVALENWLCGSSA